MASRYWPTRDTELAKRFNDELVGNLDKGDCGIIGQEVILYRVSTYAVSYTHLTLPTTPYV